MRFFSLSNFLGEKHKYDEWKKMKEDDKREVPLNGLKIFAWVIFGVFVALLFLSIFIDVKWLYKIIMYVSISFGASSMLAAFSRLGSGFFRIPISALLIMLFYSAVQPSFFADKDLAVELKAGQFMFIINFICLIGKFALLYYKVDF